VLGRTDQGGEVGGGQAAASAGIQQQALLGGQAGAGVVGRAGEAFAARRLAQAWRPRRPGLAGIDGGGYKIVRLDFVGPFVFGRSAGIAAVSSGTYLLTAGTGDAMVIGEQRRIVPLAAWRRMACTFPNILPIAMCGRSKQRSAPRGLPLMRSLRGFNGERSSEWGLEFS
jgi:hypothetical protein